jgi:hypothetical protein
LSSVVVGQSDFKYRDPGTVEYRQIEGRLLPSHNGTQIIFAGYPSPRDLLESSDYGGTTLKIFGEE